MSNSVKSWSNEDLLEYVLGRIDAFERYPGMWFITREGIVATLAQLVEFALILRGNTVLAASAPADFYAQCTTHGTETVTEQMTKSLDDTYAKVVCEFARVFINRN